MIAGFCRIFFYLGLGEILSLLCLGKVSGAVFGFILLFLDLIRTRHVPDSLGKIADRLIQSFGLFFVPAGIGVLAYKDQIRADGLAIALAVLIGTLVTIATTALSAALISVIIEKPREASEWKASQRPQP